MGEGSKIVILTDRDDLRYQAMMDRGGETSSCDWCVLTKQPKPRRGSDYHEILPRSATNKRSQSRELSYAVELCSWLCNECHIGIIHGKVSASGAAPLLIGFNIDLYGYERVFEAWQALQQSLTIPLSFQFPVKG